MAELALVVAVAEMGLVDAVDDVAQVATVAELALLLRWLSWLLLFSVAAGAKSSSLNIICCSLEIAILPHPTCPSSTFCFVGHAYQHESICLSVINSIVYPYIKAVICTC